MDWKYNLAKQVHELQDKNIVLARIYVKNKTGKYAYRTKTLLSSLYINQQKQQALLRKNKEWLVQNQKFLTEAERSQYIERKKKEVLKYICLQESSR